jgi:hypothetical protein
VNVIKSIFDKTTNLSATDYDQLILAMNNMIDLARHGRSDQTPTGSIAGYLNGDMANSLNLVFKTLEAVGITTDNTNLSDTEKIQLLLSWQSLGSYGGQQIIDNAVGVVDRARQTFDPKTGQYVNLDPSRTLQSYVEVDYIKTANQVIFDNLASLKDALNITKNILGVLQVIQNISNRIQAPTISQFAWPPQTNGDVPTELQLILQTAVTANDPLAVFYRPILAAYQQDLQQAQVLAAQNGTTITEEFKKLGGYAKAYRDLSEDNINRFKLFYRMAASAHFAQVYPSSMGTADDARTLLQARKDLSAQWTLLNQITNSSQASSDTSAAQTVLATSILDVMKDISTAFLTVDPNDPGDLQFGVRRWILDNQDKAITTTNRKEIGVYQDHIANAITTAESLNERQREDVKRYTYVFEQFYKSAQSILERLTQIIEKIAGNTGDLQ